MFESRKQESLILSLLRILLPYRMFQSPVHTLRMLALSEGISFLALIFIAMPLKYLMDLPMAVKWIGWIHGVLFMLFTLMLAYVFFKDRWPFWRGVLVFIAALIPLGPFLIDKKLKDWER